MMHCCRGWIALATVAAGGIAAAGCAIGAVQDRGPTLRGEAANGDWTTDAPGVRRLITAADIPPAGTTPSSNNHPRMAPRPEGAWPKAPAGFKVDQYTTEVRNPRLIRTAPNGDLFVAESGPGRIKILRDADGDGKPEEVSVFAEGLQQPFGINFYPPGGNPRYVYVGNTGSVVRFPYQNGDLKASGPPEKLCEIPSGGRLEGGGHWTRDVVFSRDGKRMFVSIGSRTNAMETYDPKLDERRAVILEFTPEGRNEKTYASGIRNAVGMAIHPETGELWCSVNERDGIGDDVPPEYITRVKEGGFYGWPWFYIGPNEEPIHRGKHPELKEKVSMPDVLIQAHSASLQMTFYAGSSFPREFRGQAFAAEHGSWNRARRTGYKVIRVPINRGVPTGEYEDFLVGFVTPEGNVWGRPVGVAVGKDGSLFVSDDGGNCIWRVSYSGGSGTRVR